MKVNQRLLELVYFFESHPQTTMREIQHQLSLSENAVRYEMDNLNYYLSVLKYPEIIKTNNGVYHSTIEDFEGLGKKLRAIYKSDPQERLNYLMFKLVLTGKINIRKESDFLEVSRNTIKSDLRKIRPILEKEGILIDTGRLISGDEKIIRRFISRKYKSSYMVLFSGIGKKELINPADHLVIEDFSLLDIEKLLMHINDLASNYLFTGFFEDFLLQILVNVHRIKYGYSLKAVSRQKEQQRISKEEQRHVEKIIELFAAQMNVDINDEEKHQMTTMLVKYSDKFYNSAYQKNLLAIKIFVSKLVTAVGQDLEINLSEDTILLEGLYQHVKGTIYRSKGVFEIDRQTYIQATEAYQDLIESLNAHVGKLSQPLKVSYDDADIALFAIHFLGAIRRHDEENRKNIVVLLVCPSGYGTSVLLKNFMEKNYNVTIVATASIYQISEYLTNDVAVVISTIKLPFEVKKGIDTPVLTISPFLTFEDDKNLKEFGIIQRKNPQKIPMEKLVEVLEKYVKVSDLNCLTRELKQNFPGIIEEEKLEKSLFDHLTENDITIIDHIEDWSKALHLCSQVLIGKNVINTAYCEEIENSIHLYGAHFILRNSMAIPHAGEKAGVLGSGMHVLYIKDGVIFPDNLKVWMIFFIASKEKELLINTVMRINAFSNDLNFYDVFDQKIKEGRCLAAYLKNWRKGERDD